MKLNMTENETKQQKKGRVNVQEQTNFTMLKFNNAKIEQ